MPAIVRLGDNCTGHGCYPPRPNIEACDFFFVDGLGAHRLGEEWDRHCCDDCHKGVASSASAIFFIDGIATCRVGDSVSCGSSMAEGSPEYFIGE